MLSRIPTAIKLLAVAAMFLAAPVLVYRQLEAAADDNNRLLAEGIEAQGRMAAEALRPWLTEGDGDGLARAADMVARLGAVGPELKLLFRPLGESGFFYVASHPPATAAALEHEQRELQRIGVLDRLQGGCEAARTPARRFTDADGVVVLLTSLTPVFAPSGCWVVVTADRTPEALASALGRPYWSTPAAQSAAAIYLGLAAAVAAVLTQIWLGLRRFARLARDLRRPGGGGQGGARGGEIREAAGFAALNRVSELRGVAEEFDRMVAALGAGADALRLAAHETAHAFKTPLAAISQSVEPLRRRAAGDARAERAVEIIDKSLARLDGLVAASRSLDETLADSIDPPRERVDLSALAAAVIDEYNRSHDPARIRFVGDVAPGCVVSGAVGMLEIVLQNLLDNAVGFTPPGGTVTATLLAHRRTVELRVTDEGPGADPAALERLFDRYVSMRVGGAHGGGSHGGGHFGLGLWIVRRNIEAMGGAVVADNRPQGGFQVTAVLPRAEG
jgi:two-component system, OmpR family, sensor histidine kinase ChvG